MLRLLQAFTPKRRCVPGPKVCKDQQLAQRHVVARPGLRLATNRLWRHTSRVAPGADVQQVFQVGAILQPRRLPRARRSQLPTVHGRELRGDMQAAMLVPRRMNHCGSHALTKRRRSTLTTWKMMVAMHLLHGGSSMGLAPHRRASVVNRAALPLPKPRTATRARLLLQLLVMLLASAWLTQRGLRQHHVHLSRRMWLALRPRLGLRRGQEAAWVVLHQQPLWTHSLQRCQHLS